MSKLELKIPPVLLIVLFAIAMWLMSLMFPSISMTRQLRVILLLLSTVVGAFFAIAGIISFRNAKTTANPMTPDASSSLVSNGIYQYSRNPMYVGFLFFLIGWGLFLSNLGSLALCIGFIAYMNRFQIMPEERFLTAIFSEEFLIYKKNVRRWL